MVSTAHVRLATDLSRREAEEAAWALEDFHRALAVAFVGCDGPVGDVSTDVTMFTDGGQYRSVAPHDAFGFMREGTWAVATIPAHVALPAGPGISRGAVLQTFAHELIHRFVHLCLRSAPVWLDEGLAMYFETVRVHEDDLVLGAAPFRIDHTGPAVGIRRDGVRVTRFDRAIPMATELVSLAPADFYRFDQPFAARQPHYVAAWALVHLLLGSGDAALRSRFVSYLTTLRSGEADASTAFASAFEGVDLDGALAGYVQRQPSAVVHRSYSARGIGRPAVRDMEPEEVHVRMAELLRTRDPAAALAHARAAEASPLYAPHAILIEALLAEQSERETLIARAVALAPSEPEVVRARAFLVEMDTLAGNDPRAGRAERAVLRATFGRWQSPSAIDLVFWSRLELLNGNEQLAVSLAERAVALAPDASEPRFALAEALEWAHRRAESRAHYVAAMNRAVEHEPQFAASIAEHLAAMAASARPIPTGTPPAYDDTVTAGALDFATPVAIAGVTASGFDASTLGAPCVGVASQAPTVRLQVPPGARRAVIWVESTVDTTLALLTADGHVRCDDDSGGGLSPAIDDAWNPGEIPIWVGAFRAEDAGTPFTLHVDAERAMQAGDVPSACGVDATTAERWGTVSVGMRVVLGQHMPFSGTVSPTGRAVEDSTDWAPATDAFAGREARVLYMLGTDYARCAIARVDVDGERWSWRLRDLRPPP